jgi:hypothetical protein
MPSSTILNEMKGTAMSDVSAPKGAAFSPQSPHETPGKQASRSDALGTETAAMSAHTHTPMHQGVLSSAAMDGAHICV